MRYVLGVMLVLAASRCVVAQSPVDVKKAAREPLVDQVRKAIERGVQFLKDQENGRGHWELDSISARAPGGETALALLALLNAGVKPTDPVIDRGLEYLRKVSPQYTYVVGLQTMVFAAAGKDKDKELLQRNVDWLIKAQNQRGGWTYQTGGGGADNSNTQYALLGLHEGHWAGAKIDADVWKGIRDFYVRTQQADGGWGYNPFVPVAGNGSPLTMSTAGLCGLYIAGLELNDRREVFRQNGTVENCGAYQENDVLRKAHAYVGRRLDFQLRHAKYYNLYGIERTGRLSGERFLGHYDWYREGCQILVKDQNADGGWVQRSPHDSWPIVSTSFALLFLSKGRTPVLISKLAHDPGDDWNNDRNDVRHLVDYASKEVFKRQPLAWQIFRPRSTDLENHAQFLETVADLLQSPIAYFNGHRAPVFHANEVKLLREYLDQGGFILAEACCGDKRFDVGFRDLVRQLDLELQPLPAEHPIWRAHADIPPGSFDLEGVQQGCKTVLVYCPPPKDKPRSDLSCLWESKQIDTPEGRLAFRLGGNIIAYATGLEIPKPRLTPVEVIDAKNDKEKIPRGVLKAAQVRHEGDWQPAPRALRNLMLHLRERVRLDVTLDTRPIRLNDSALADYKFLYMHGRNAFAVSDEGLVNLRANLQTHGLLLADACCGKKEFDASFRACAAKLFPDLKLEPIPLSDELYGKELNGTAIDHVRCRRDRRDGGAEAEFKEYPPFLEGIKYRGRWVVIYSKYDLGCALEKHRSSDCKGHDHDSALRLAGAAVLYFLRPIQ